MSVVKLMRMFNWILGFVCLSALIFYGAALGLLRVPLAGLAIGSLAIDALIVKERKRAIIMAIAAVLVAMTQVPLSLFQRGPAVAPSRITTDVG